MKVGIIGVGNMGYAIAKGLSSKLEKKDILFYDLNPVNKARMEEHLEKKVEENANSLVLKSDYIILAVKPFIYDKVLAEISNSLTEEKTIISIAPGLSLDYLNKHANKAGVVRAMPNTPARVLEGMTGICFDKNKFSDEKIEEIENIFSAFGKSVILDENLMDAVVAISGCSPAYFYVMIEAMADAAVAFGLTRDKAYTMAAQSMLGSAKMVLETGEHPAKLKDDVCSPGGATIAGVNVLNSLGFRESITEAMKACHDKSKAMGNKN